MSILQDPAKRKSLYYFPPGRVSQKVAHPSTSSVSSSSSGVTTSDNRHAGQLLTLKQTDQYEVSITCKCQTCIFTKHISYDETYHTLVLQTGTDLWDEKSQLFSICMDHPLIINISKWNKISSSYTLFHTITFQMMAFEFLMDEIALNELFEFCIDNNRFVFIFEYSEKQDLTCKELKIQLPF